MQSTNWVYFSYIRTLIDYLISATIVHTATYYSPLLLDSECLSLLTILDNPWYRMLCRYITGDLTETWSSAKSSENAKDATS